MVYPTCPETSTLLSDKATRYIRVLWSAEMKIELLAHNPHLMFGEKKGSLQTVNEGTGSNMLWGCSAAFQKLKPESGWIFKMESYTKHTSKSVTNWIKDNKVKVLERSRSPFMARL